MSINKTEIHLEFNTFHAPFFDSFFYYVTYLGDGWTALVIGLLLLAVRMRYALVVGFSNIVSAFITQFLKHSVFADAVRPKKFFEGVHDLYFVPGVENYLYNSFPSGHTTCAFSLCLGLAMITESNLHKLGLFIIALLIGYSRVYLSQHFFEDIYAGAFIGSATTLLIGWWMLSSKRAWMDHSVIRLFQQP